MSIDAKDEFSYFWRIENFDYISTTERQTLVSPKFVPGTMQGTQWSLKLALNLPIDRSSQPVENHIACYLQRKLKDDGPENFTLNFEIAFLAWNGVVLGSTCVKKCEMFFKKNTRSSKMLAIKQSQVLKNKKEIYIPQGVFTIRCRMWGHQKNNFKTERIWAVNRICIERVSFIRKFEEFGVLWNLKSLRVHPRDKEKPMMLVGTMIEDGSCLEDKISVKMIVVERKFLNKFLCKVFLLDNEGNKIQCGIVDAHCDLDERIVLNVPLLFSRKQLIDRKSEFLPDDALSLQFEFCFSNGTFYEEVTKTEYDAHLIPREQIRNDLDAPETLSADLISLYNDKILCDIELKTETKTFFAHKTVLCARSSVFRSMLTNGMRESRNKCIEIEDLKEETVDRMLHFLYTDSLEDVQWETAFNLYYAGEKYDIRLLKVICASFLKRKLSTSNAVNVLVLAEMHQDSNLKTSAVNFILLHDKEIFDSYAWEVLANSNPRLSVEVMLLRYNKYQGP